MKPVIYLAGPMSGLTWGQAREWRDKVTLELGNKWTCLTPAQLKNATEEISTDIISFNKRTDDDAKLHINHTATGICTQDEFYIRRSDFLLANFTDSKETSAGTMWELGASWMLGKQIISVVQPGNVHDTVFVRRRSHIFVPYLSEALDYLKNITTF